MLGLCSYSMPRYIVQVVLALCVLGSERRVQF